MTISILLNHLTGGKYINYDYGTMSEGYVTLRTVMTAVVNQGGRILCNPSVLPDPFNRERPIDPELTQGFEGVIEVLDGSVSPMVNYEHLFPHGSLTVLTGFSRDKCVLDIARHLYAHQRRFVTADDILFSNSRFNFLELQEQSTSELKQLGTVYPHAEALKRSL